MKKQKMHIAKITRPAGSNILLRPRLFQKLKGNGTAPLTWVSGPPGCGKTTCVSSFIAAREAPCIWYKIDSSDTSLQSFFNYLAQACRQETQQAGELPAPPPDNDPSFVDFCRDFFARLSSSLNDSFYLVFDNYQEVSEDVPLHDLLLDALNLLPEEANIIIISRSEPPAKFSRLRINRRMNQVTGRDLRFSRDEFHDAITRWGYGELPEKAVNRIFTKLDGWIAGLVFMLDSTRIYDTSLQNVGTGALEAIFHYFAEEIFNYQDKEIQHFLMKTAVLPFITPKYAMAVTGITKSCRILTSLQWHNMFVDKLNGPLHDAYRYHPLFKEYLVDRLAEHFAAEEIINLQRVAAARLFEDDRAEEASALLMKSRDWDGLVAVINDTAELLLSQDRPELLQQWLAEMPTEKLRQNPWLFYWWGQSLQQSDPALAKEHYSNAFEKFCERHDMAGAFSACGGLIDSIIINWHNFMELDRLIDWLEQRFPEEQESLPRELGAKLAVALVAALMIRRPGSGSLAKWVAYVENEAGAAANEEMAMQTSLVLGNYYLWLGDQSKCWMLLGRIRNLCRSQKISSLAVLQCKSLEAMIYAWLQSDGAKCLATVEDALEIAGFAGVRQMNHVLYDVGAFGALIERDYARMGEYLRRLESTLDSSMHHGRFCHDYLSAWLSLMRGNTQRGGQHARQALKKVKGTGYVLHEALAIFAEAQILFARGKFPEAKACLEQFKEIAEPTGSFLLQYMYYLSRAQFSLDLGMDEVGLKYLRKAMQLGREENFMSLMCWWNPAAMTKLSMYALDHDIETEYVRSLVSKQGLVPQSWPVEIEQWPWPLKIYTFGRFEIVRDGRPVRSGAKSQQKPLALLKALIAMGGRNVAEFRLADALWPDADGDMQHQSLATTLHRLRRILGDKDAVEFQDGHISLNPKYCWVDGWAFERLLSQAEIEARKREEEGYLQAVRCARKAIELYKGNFLPENSMEHWSIHMRERLKSRFLRGVSFLGRNLEKIGEPDKAISFYLKALEIDPLVEEFYQRLLICYHRMGRHADAVLVFRRCLKNFDKILGVSPSTQTRALYHNLLVKQFNSREKMNPDQKKYHL